MNQIAGADTADSDWKALYKVGGVAALIAVLLFRRNLGSEFVLLRYIGVFQFGPATPPISAGAWFDLLHGHPFLGLTLLNLFDVVNYALVGLIYLALYGALRRTNKSAMVIATSFGLVGMAVYFASNQAFAMLTLSHRYAAATDAAQRAMFLAAGESLLALGNPGTLYLGFGTSISLLLVTLAGLIISIVMLQSHVFGKVTAYVGILAHVFGLGLFIALAFAPAIAALPPSISAVFLLIWYILIARRLFQLG